MGNAPASSSPPPAVNTAPFAEKAHGENHPEVGIDLNNLAQLLQNTNRLAEAEPMIQEALRIFEDSLGNEHPNSVLAGKNRKILQKKIRR